VTVGRYLDFATPEGLRVRGTVVVIPGRGESAQTYQRFGRRIAADAYHVRVLAGREIDFFSADPLPGLADELAAAVDDLGDGLIRPLVLVGADASAAAVAALVAGSLVAESQSAGVWRPDGVVLAAPPGYGRHDTGSDWDAELAVRTHCPAHRGALSGDESVVHGTLGGALPDALLDLAYGSTVAIAHLLLVGDSDPIADPDALTRLAKALPVARLSVVRGAHHDVLNDLQHRSVAAEVVGFLEVLRDGEPFRPIVATEVTAW
jgi:hypothetical protein